MFTSVSCVVPVYESSMMMISAHMSTRKRFVVVCHCVTVAFLTPFFGVQNDGDTFLSR